MKSVSSDSKQKDTLIKRYEHLWQVEQAIHIILASNTEPLHPSVLGTINKKNKDDEQLLTIKGELEDFCKNLLDPLMNFGFLKVPEIGLVFAAGPLAKILLNRVEGKAIGEMSTGIYGVLRGLGASQFQATEYIKILKNGGYLVATRSYPNVLRNLDAALLQENTKDWNDNANLENKGH